MKPPWASFTRGRRGIPEMLGKEFPSYDALHQFLVQFQRENNVDIHKDKCIRLASKCVQSRYGFKAFKSKKELVYFSLEYRCIMGGSYKPRGKGKRSTWTYRQGCPFLIKIGVSDNGQCLVVKSFCNTHNHDNSKELYLSFPRQRCKYVDTKSKVELTKNPVLPIKRTFFQEESETDESASNFLEVEYLDESSEDSEPVASIAPVEKLHMKETKTVGETTMKNATVIDNSHADDHLKESDYINKFTDYVNAALRMLQSTNQQKFKIIKKEISQILLDAVDSE